VLSLALLKRLALSAWVMTSEPRPQPPCAKPLPARAEEGPAIIATAKESSALPPPVAATVVEEGQPAVETTALQAPWSRRLGPARAAHMWWWSWTKIWRLPHRRGIMMS
jgi:hypothetical protein